MPVEEQFFINVVSKSPAHRGGEKAPTIAAAQHAIVDMHALLHPRRQMGHGHKAHTLRPFVAQRLQEMLTFLRVYVQSTQEWMRSLVVAAKFLGRGGYFAQQLRCWSLTFILDRNKLPDKRLLTGTTSRLQDEDIKLDVNMHLQSLGKYVSAMDLVRYF